MRQKGCLHNLLRIDPKLDWVFLSVTDYLTYQQNVFPKKTFLNHSFAGMSKQMKAVKLVTEMCVDKAKKCDPTVPFRSIDGTCNNLKNGWLGAMSTPFKRDVAPVNWDVEDISTSLVDLTTLFGTDRIGNYQQIRTLHQTVNSSAVPNIVVGNPKS